MRAWKHFTTLIKFMKSMNWTSVWRKQSHRWRNEWHKRLWSRIHATAEDCEHLIYSWFNSTHANVIEANLNTSRLKSIAVVDRSCHISQGNVVTHLTCGGKYDANLVAVLLPRPTVKKNFLNQPTFLKVMNEYQVASFLWMARCMCGT